MGGGGGFSLLMRYPNAFVEKGEVTKLPFSAGGGGSISGDGGGGLRWEAYVTANSVTVVIAIL